MYSFAGFGFSEATRFGCGFSDIDRAFQQDQLDMVFQKDPLDGFYRLLDFCLLVSFIGLDLYGSKRLIKDKGLRTLDRSLLDLDLKQVRLMGGFS